MTLTGDMIIGWERRRGKGGTFRAHLADGTGFLEPAFGTAEQADIDRACTLAERAFPTYRQLVAARRADFLEAIADQILSLGDALPERAHEECGLPVIRLREERDRTVRQLRFFARIIHEGRDQAPIINLALPDRQPPRPDIRLRRIPLGPVAVFGASNFPLAFSVAGGDTASALAAGCPVVVKAHEAHPGTSEMVGCAILQAARMTDMPQGVFSLVFSKDFSAGEYLVKHPAIQAVGFTGSRRGGQALLRMAQMRSQPIPLYAEMSSINPVFLLPASLEARGDEIAKGFAASLTTRVGQLCTNPGLVVGLARPDLDRFETTVGEALTDQAACPMLTEQICRNWHESVARLSAHPAVTRVAGTPDGGNANRAAGVLFRTDAATFLSDPVLEEEAFGPSSLLVVCQDQSDMERIAARLEGQLTATLILDQADYPLARTLVSLLECRVGRILVNGYPTGVEVCDAMVHGGPWPSTSDSRTTSVGSTAIDRFLRPVCYQNIPDALLPDSLKDKPDVSIWRFQEGTYIMPSS